MSPDLAVSQVLAPADAAVWARPKHGLLQEDFELRREVESSTVRPHRCTAACQPYTGPVRLGRDGEQITPGRP